MGWWERRDLPQRLDDIIYTVTPSTAGRPDLIAFQIYGQDKYSWIVLQYNNIVDLAQELTPGDRIHLPAVNRLMIDILNQSTGGTLVG